MPRIFSNTLRRRQLDTLLKPPLLRTLKRPPKGWIREVRNALGMSAAQLASRMGVSQPTVAKLEHTEADDAITLRSLRKAALAMDCELVYAFVPNTSLESTLETQALQRAATLLRRVEHTMALEAQGRGDAGEAEVKELAQEMIRTLIRDIWAEAS